MKKKKKTSKGEWGQVWWKVRLTKGIDWSLKEYSMIVIKKITKESHNSIKLPIISYYAIKQMCQTEPNISLSSPPLL